MTVGSVGIASCPNTPSPGRTEPQSSFVTYQTTNQKVEDAVLDMINPASEGFPMGIRITPEAPVVTRHWKACLKGGGIFLLIGAASIAAGVFSHSGAGIRNFLGISRASSPSYGALNTTRYNSSAISYISSSSGLFAGANDSSSSLSGVLDSLSASLSTTSEDHLSSSSFSLTGSSTFYSESESSLSGASSSSGSRTSDSKSSLSSSISSSSSAVSRMSSLSSSYLSSSSALSSSSSGTQSSSSSSASSVSYGVQCNNTQKAVALLTGSSGAVKMTASFSKIDIGGELYLQEDWTPYSLELPGFQVGNHAMAIFDTNTCIFKGGELHFNPYNKPHGQYQSIAGNSIHVGDLGNRLFTVLGRYDKYPYPGGYWLTNSGADFKGPGNILGKAMVFSAYADDGVTQPIGTTSYPNAPQYLCGIITATDCF